MIPDNTVEILALNHEKFGLCMTIGLVMFLCLSSNNSLWLPKKALMFYSSTDHHIMHYIFLENASSTASAKAALWVPLCKPKKLFQLRVLFWSELQCVPSVSTWSIDLWRNIWAVFCWTPVYYQSVTLQWHWPSPLFSHRSLCSPFVDFNQNIPFCIVCCLSHLQKRTPVPYHLTCMFL